LEQVACATWCRYKASGLEQTENMVTKRWLKQRRSRCLQPSVVHACSITRLPHKTRPLHTHHHITCSFISHASQKHNEFWAQCAKSSRLPVCSRPPTTVSSTTACHSLKKSGSLGFAARLSRALRHQGITPPYPSSTYSPPRVQDDSILETIRSYSLSHGPYIPLPKPLLAPAPCMCPTARHIAGSYIRLAFWADAECCELA
jgi:hypothetical protein